MHDDHTKVLPSGTSHQPGNVLLKSTVSYRTVRGMVGEGHLSEHIEPDILVYTGEPSPGEVEMLCV